MKNIFKQARLIDKIFEIGVLIKALFGFFEIFGGILFSISGQKIVDSFILKLAQQEIAEDPSDLIANYIIKLTNDFSLGTQIFASFYLISHGIVNIFLAVFLLKGRLWAYPTAIGFFSAFILYQVYRFFHTYSLLLLLLIVFDIFVVSVIWLEYKKRRKRLSHKM